MKIYIQKKDISDYYQDLQNYHKFILKRSSDFFSKTITNIPNSNHVLKNEAMNV